MLQKLTDFDREVTLEYLQRQGADSAFIIANVKEFGLDNRQQYRRCGDYYGYFVEGRLAGVLPFYNLGSCIPHYEDERAISLFCETMATRKFEYLLGMKRIVEPLYEGIRDRKKTKKLEESGYYINQSPCYKDIAGARYYDMGEIDREEAIAFVTQSYREGFHREMSREEVEKMLNQRNKEEEFLIMEVDGRYVAQANIQTFTDSINQIGGVYTLIQEQGKGYCKGIISELCRRIAYRGKTPTLIVRRNNISAVRAYEAVGFAFWDDYLLIELEV